MREISRDSGVNLGGLYAYVRNKQDVLNLIYEKALLGMERYEELHDFSSVREFIKSYLLNTWRLYDKEARVLYLNTFALNRRMIEKVKASEINYVEWIAERINEVTGFGKEKQEILLMAANLLVFLGGFHALRGWSIKPGRLEDLVDMVADMFASILGNQR